MSRPAVCSARSPTGSGCAGPQRGPAGNSWLTSPPGSGRQRRSHPTAWENAEKLAEPQKRGALSADGSLLFAGAFARRVEERSDEVHRQREHHCGPLIATELQQGLQVAQLNRGRAAAEDF